MKYVKNFILISVVVFIVSFSVAIIGGSSELSADTSIQRDLAEIEYMEEGEAKEKAFEKLLDKKLYEIFGDDRRAFQFKKNLLNFVDVLEALDSVNQTEMNSFIQIFIKHAEGINNFTDAQYLLGGTFQLFEGETYESFRKLLLINNSVIMSDWLYSEMLFNWFENFRVFTVTVHCTEITGVKGNRSILYVNKDVIEPGNYLRVIGLEPFLFKSRHLEGTVEGNNIVAVLPNCEGISDNDSRKRIVFVIE